MIVDIHCHLGHWPFRPLRHNTAAGLVERMDRFGIDSGVVSSLDAVFYRDAQAGNEELAEATADWPDRFRLLATVNPRYAGWERDLDRCVEGLGMKGLRLVPQYHDYDLTDTHGQSVLAAAAERNLPVAIPQRLEDRRQRHHFDDARDLTGEEILGALKAHPRLPFVLLNGTGYENVDLLDEDAFRERPFLIDITRLTAVLQASIPKLVHKVGAEKVAFGTGMPVNYPSPALIKLDVLDAPKEVKEKIAWRNAAAMFGEPAP